MVGHTLFDYNDKNSVIMFYNFYQNFLLNDYIFENLGSYQSFIEKLRKNDLYNALVLHGEDELGGAIFEYDKNSNLGIIHYLGFNESNEYLEQEIFDLVGYYTKKIAEEYCEEEPIIVSRILKTKDEEDGLDIVHNDEYFLKKILIPSINSRIKK